MRFRDEDIPDIADMPPLTAEFWKDMMVLGERDIEALELDSYSSMIVEKHIVYMSGLISLYEDQLGIKDD